MRLSGLASGMDIDSMVKQMLSVDRIKVDRAQQNKQKLEWKQKLYNDINKDLAEFIVNAKKEFGILKGSISGIDWHKQAISSDDTKVSATVKGIKSFSGDHKLVVKKLAEGVTKTSSDRIGLGEGWTAENIKNIPEEGFEFSINGKEISVVKTDNLSSIARKINSAGAGVKASYDSTLDRFFLQTSGVGTNAKIQISGVKNDDGSFENLSESANSFLGSLKLGLTSSFKSTEIDENWTVGVGGINFTINEKDISLTEGKSLSDLIGELNEVNGVFASYSEGKLYLDGDISSEDYVNIEGAISKNFSSVSKDLEQYTYNFEKDWKVGSGIDSLTIEGETVSISEDDTLGSIVSKINSAGISGVKASYITNDDGSMKLTIVGMDIDASNAFTVSANPETEFPEAGAGQHSVIGTSELGSKGSVSYNGLDFEEVDTNIFIYNGVEFTAKAKSEVIDLGGDLTDPTNYVGETISITTNADEAYEKIEKFIEEYNKIVDKVGGYTAEKYDRSYQPLTDEQKEAMTEDEIELWEERAKRGLLYRDGTINDMLSTVRSGLYQSVKGFDFDKVGSNEEYGVSISGTYSHLTEIGITTQKYSQGSVGGKLWIDPKDKYKLKEALETDPDSVMNMLFRESDYDYDAELEEIYKDDPDKADKIAQKKLEIARSESGIFTRMVDDLASGMKEIISKSGLGDSRDILAEVKVRLTLDFAIKGSISTIDKEIYSINSQIDDLNSWLYSREDAYYARFTAMEKAMQEANNQSSWLYQQMGM